MCFYCFYCIYTAYSVHSCLSSVHCFFMSLAAWFKMFMFITLYVGASELWLLGAIVSSGDWLIDNIFIRFDRIHERDRRTDSGTDRHRMTA